MTYCNKCGFLGFCILLSVFLVVNVIAQLYTTETEFDDLKTETGLISEDDSESLSDCAFLCKHRCHCFGFNSFVNKCRLHRFCVMEEMSSTEAGWKYYCTGYTALPKDCQEYYNNGQTQSGIYGISPYRKRCHVVYVFCDMVTNGGGWTAIQRRRSGVVSFEKTWVEYKIGFGEAVTAYWIGNEIIHLFTKDINPYLYVSITLNNGTSYHQMYDQFSVSDEADKYRLFLAGPSQGTLGDRMLNTGVADADISGMFFSTPDQDNDGTTAYDCAATYRAGWWFNYCHHALLNGQWYPQYWYLPWFSIIPDGTDVNETLMMIKRH
ncbi:fibroleukin-like [Saccostrea echinata]|uniref:fibroleukin-like n=1 Tax=Saccostrea echinata TaxID=191078 RepID=UPI002A82A349|nr:fibroleukin-like [Saccostrea echinata]